jgi:hypothetical protein
MKSEQEMEETKQYIFKRMYIVKAREPSALVLDSYPDASGIFALLISTVTVPAGFSSNMNFPEGASFQPCLFSENNHMNFLPAREWLLQ